MEYFTVVLRTFIFYIIITLVYRFMGKREVGELGIIDLIVSILIAELAAMSIENYKASLFISVFPILLLVILQIVFAKISLNNSKIRDVFDGKPSVIINKGKVNFKEMIKQRYNLDDLLSQLREKSIRNIDEVDYAVLENNGKLSVFRKNKGSDFPLPVILDGTIQEDILKQLNKNKLYIENILKKEKIKLDNIFYAFFKNDKLFIIKNSDLQ